MSEGREESETRGIQRQGSSGIIVYTQAGEPLRLTLMDENDNKLNYVEELQEGVYGYESPDSNVAVILEKP